MPRHIAERATEPFFTTKGTGKGTGLGLAMASGFVQQSRGRLEIDSEPGQGTTVRMLFPVALTEDVAEPVPLSDAPVSARPEADARAAHILVVEDSPEVLALSREILEEVGYRVTVAEDGDEAMRKFEALGADAFDLLFTDLVMPGSINGIVLAERIAELAPDLPVLMTTGYNEDLVVDGPTRSALDVLGKPYRRSDLLDRVRQALNRRGQSHERRRISDFGAAEE